MPLKPAAEVSLNVSALALSLLFFSNMLVCVCVLCFIRNKAHVRRLISATTPTIYKINRATHRRGENGVGEQWQCSSSGTSNSKFLGVVCFLAAVQTRNSSTDGTSECNSSSANIFDGCTNVAFSSDA